MRAALADFGPLWHALSTREQVRVIELLVETVAHDGRDGTYPGDFVPVGRGQRGGIRVKIMVKFKSKKAEPPAKVPRIAKLMALAIHFDHLIREGKVRDQAEIAELGHVTRARVTQILELLLLAPDLQEEILLVLDSKPGRDAVTERQLRPVAALSDWSKQRRMWAAFSKTKRGAEK